jgi:hypothetical protein
MFVYLKVVERNINNKKKRENEMSYFVKKRLDITAEYILDVIDNDIFKLYTLLGLRHPSDFMKSLKYNGGFLNLTIEQQFKEMIINKRQVGTTTNAKMYVIFRTLNKFKHHECYNTIIEDLIECDVKCTNLSMQNTVIDDIMDIFRYLGLDVEMFKVESSQYKLFIK